MLPQPNFRPVWGVCKYLSVVFCDHVSLQKGRNLGMDPVPLIPKRGPVDGIVGVYKNLFPKVLTLFDFFNYNKKNI